MKRALAILRTGLPSWADLHVYGGIALLSWGAWSVWPPAGRMVLGLLLLGLGLLFAKPVTVKTRGGGS